MRCRLFYTCRPAGAWVRGIVALLHTFRPSGAFKGWCAVRTLQMYFSNRILVSRTARRSVFAPIVVYHHFDEFFV